MTFEVLHEAHFCRQLQDLASAKQVNVPSAPATKSKIQTLCNAFGSRSPGLFALRRLEPDLSCLVAPAVPQEARLFSWALGAQADRTGAQDILYEIAQFINGACDVALQPDGSLSPLHQQRIHLEQRLEERRTTAPPQAAAHIAAQLPTKCSNAECWLQGYRDISSIAERCPTVNVSGMPASQFMRQVLLQHKPVKLVGTGAQLWPTSRKWGPEHLLRTVGDSPVHVKVSPGGIFEGSESVFPWLCGGSSRCPGVNGTEGVPPHIRSKMESPDRVVSRPAVADIPVKRLLQVFRQVQQAREVGTPPEQLPSLYVEYLSMSSSLHALWQDVRMNTAACGDGEEGTLCRLAAQLQLQHANVWIGDGHTTGKAHFDAFENFLVPISGSKEVFMWPPYNSSRLYEGHMREAHFKFRTTDGHPPDSSDDIQAWLPVRALHGLAQSTSMVNTPLDVQQPDLQRYPAFKDALPHSHVCNVHAAAGEVLFLPSYWWHEVLSQPADDMESGEGLHHNLAVNFWYKPLYTRRFPCRHCSWQLDMSYGAAVSDSLPKN